MEQKSLGLIAGNGNFPLLFAQKAKKENFKLFVVAVKGDTSFLMNLLADQVLWLKVGELQKLFSYFKENGVSEVLMAGQVNPNNLFDPRIILDDDFKKLFEALENRKADTIFSAVAEKLNEYGMRLLDSTFLLKDYLAPEGVLTKRHPTVEESEDIAFGRDIAKSMGGLDVGQTVVIKQKAILAIEAMEGTDKAILRGGKIARNNAVVVKMSKPEQDFRFDVPVAGMRTIQNMIKVKARCLAVEAHKTILIDSKKMIEWANKNNICIIAVK